MSDLCAKTVVLRFTRDEVLQHIIDVPGDGYDSDKENLTGEEGDQEVDPEELVGAVCPVNHKGLYQG